VASGVASGVAVATGVGVEVATVVEVAATVTVGVTVKVASSTPPLSPKHAVSRSVAKLPSKSAALKLSLLLARPVHPDTT
jgi:hypothetical protein